MQISPYLSFNGQCEAAFRFYEQRVGGKIVAMLTYGNSPAAEQCAADMHGKIMHARLILDGQTLMGSDSPHGRYEETRGMSVALGIDNPEKAEWIFSALAENGTIQMPIQETFWAHRFGMLVDQFGIPWMINCERTDNKPGA
ncbi:MAG TPA: VOC family protein [Nitrosospira sp.]|nr:VOC family protein [Nitrosospira sp.]